jgi:hypothetical protein
MTTMKKLLFTFYILLFTCYFASAQDWIWGKGGYGSEKSNVYGAYVAADKRGNAYVCGMFNTAVTFAPFTLTQSSDNAYFVKYNSAGIVQWALIPPNEQDGLPVAVDTAGYVYITGWYNNTSTYYLTKYDSNGNVVWTKDPGYVFSDGSAITSDKRGYIYTSGCFTNILVLGKDTLIAPAGSTQFFVAKYDLNGNIIWARQSSATDSNTYIHTYTSIAVDDAGNVYMEGTYEKSIRYGSYYATAPVGSSAAVYVKYDINGNLKWAITPGSGYSDPDDEPYSIATDKANNSYITGSYMNSINFGSIILSNTGGKNVFLVKYDTNGNAVWAEQATGSNETPSLTRDDNNNLYMGCWSYKSFAFGGVSFSSVDMSDCILKIDTAGRVQCGSIINNPQKGVNIATDFNGKFFYLAGVTYDTIHIGPDTLPSNGSQGVPVLARWCPCTGSDVTAQCSVEGINELSAYKEGITLYPNPNNGEFTIQSSVGSRQSTVDIYNMLGERIYSNSFSTLHSQFLINLSGQPAGIYLYRVTSESGKIMEQGKFIIN